MYAKPSHDIQFDCYADVVLDGLQEIEYDQDYTCLKSKTGYLIELMSCPLICVPMLQDQIDPITMEQTYIDLSHFMRYLIVIRRILQEINDNMFSKMLEEP